jgi:hypothetical protein
VQFKTTKNEEMASILKGQEKKLESNSKGNKIPGLIDEGFKTDIMTVLNKSFIFQ